MAGAVDATSCAAGVLDSGAADDAERAADGGLRKQAPFQMKNDRTKEKGEQPSVADVEVAARAAAAAAREQAKAHVARLLRLYFAQVPQSRRWQRTVLTSRFVLRCPLCRTASRSAAPSPPRAACADRPLIGASRFAQAVDAVRETSLLTKKRSDYW